MKERQREERVAMRQREVREERDERKTVNLSQEDRLKVKYLPFFFFFFACSTTTTAKLADFFFFLLFDSFGLCHALLAMSLRVGAVLAVLAATSLAVPLQMLSDPKARCMDGTFSG